MATTVYIPREATALALGAEQVARAVAAEAARRGEQVRIVRNGSRGAFWLEPLVEVQTASGRCAYGPVRALLAVGPFLVMLLVIVAYPETAHLELEALNPEDAVPVVLPPVSGTS